MEELEITVLSMNDGTTYNVHKHVKDYIFINFWASWCSFCVEELPTIQKLFNTFKDKIDFIIVNCGENRDFISTFLKERRYTFPVGYDLNGTLADYYKVKGIPRTIILDKNNKVYRDIVGYNSFEKLREIIAAIK